MITHLVRLLNLRHLRRQRVRTLLSMLGVVLGVTTFIFGPSIAASIQASVSLTSSDLTGNSQIEVRSTENGFDVRLLDTIRATPGVDLAAPVSTSGGLILGQPELLVFVGIDPGIDRQMRRYTVARGNFLQGAGEVLLSDAYAREKGLMVGSKINLISVGGVRELLVAGTLAADGMARMNGGDILFLALDDALALRGSRNIDSVSVIGAADLASRLRQALPGKITVENAADRLKATNQFQFLINGLLITVATLVLAIGSILIYHTMAVSVAQRRSEIGVLRALGMTRAQIVWLFMLEATMLGAVASALGVVAGYAMTRFGSGLPLVPRFSSELLTSSADVNVPPWLPPIAFVAGVLISTLAGYWPSRHAARIDPVEALVAIRSEATIQAFPWRRLALAIVLLGVLVLIRLATFSDMLTAMMVANAGVMLTLLTMALLVAPVLIGTGSVLPGIAYKLLGMPGFSAATNLVRRPKRMLMTASLITIGVGGGAYISSSNFGYTDMIAEWNKTENVGDLTVAGAGLDPFSPMLPLQASVIQSLSARADVDALITERLFVTKQNSVTLRIRAIDMKAFRRAGGAFLWNRGDETTAYARLTAADSGARPAILVSANMMGITSNMVAGKTLSIETPSGPVEFDIVGSILGRIESDAVVVIMDRSDYARLWKDATVDRAMLKLKPGTDVQSVRRGLLRQFALNGAIVYSNGDVRDAFAKPITAIRTVSSLMSSLLALILVAGLASTMFVQVLDRRREIGMLRAVGMLPGEITQSILLEIVLMVAVGALIGFPIAYIMTGLQELALQQVMGIPFSVNLGQAIFTVGILCVAGLLATAVPAQSAGQTNILEAMRYE